MQIISTRFNGNIANACQNIIFSEFDARYHLASYFNDVSFEISEEDMEVFYEKALRVSSSENISERDNALACLLVLWNNKPLERYRDDIVTTFGKMVKKRCLYRNYIIRLFGKNYRIQNRLISQNCILHI